MKKYVAFLLCLIMLSSLFSCNVDKENYTDSSTGDTTDKEQNSTQPSDDTAADNNASTDNNNTTTDEPILERTEENYIAMRAYAAASERNNAMAIPPKTKPNSEIPKLITAFANGMENNPYKTGTSAISCI